MKSRTRDRNRKHALERRLQAQQREYRALTAKLSAVGFIWNGTVQRRVLTCGKSHCACHRDPQSRHGPYAYWTTKVRNRTVSRLLTDVEANLYEEWVDNRRRLEATQRKMLALSKKAAPAILSLRKTGRRS
jgi:hypothetical protein